MAVLPALGTGAPHFGHAVAEVLTSAPHSLHLTNAIEATLPKFRPATSRHHGRIATRRLSADVQTRRNSAAHAIAHKNAAGGTPAVACRVFECTFVIT